MQGDLYYGRMLARLALEVQAFAARLATTDNAADDQFHDAAAAYSEANEELGHALDALERQKEEDEPEP